MMCVPTGGSPLRSLEADGVAMSGPAWTSFLTRFEAAYRAELLAFLCVTRGEIPSPCTALDALQAMRISVAATRSRSERRPVRLEEIRSDLGARKGGGRRPIERRGTSAPVP
ncbi:MAG: Gfo/Idh/MocA family oxidoreductase [Chloroflexota bacterium]